MHDMEVLRELRTATDLVLRATKVTVLSLGRAMSTLVIQERQLCLCLADMRNTDKIMFLNALRTSPSSPRLHRSRLRPLSTSCPSDQLLPPPSCSALASLSPPHSLQLSNAVEPIARQPPRPFRPLLNQAASGRARDPETGSHN